MNVILRYIDVLDGSTKIWNVEDNIWSYWEFIDAKTSMLDKSFPESHTILAF